MGMIVSLFASAVLSSTPAPDGEQLGLHEALRACNEWVLNPASWIDGPSAFLDSLNSGVRMRPATDGTVSGVHLWEVGPVNGASYRLAVSDRSPTCQITGSGNRYLMADVEASLSGGGMGTQWEALEDAVSGDVRTSTFRHRQQPAFRLVVSVVARGERVEMIATAQLEPRGSAMGG